MNKAGFQGIQSQLDKSLKRTPPAPKKYKYRLPPKTKMNHVLTCIWTDWAVLGSTEISAVKAKVCYF